MSLGYDRCDRPERRVHRLYKTPGKYGLFVAFPSESGRFTRTPMLQTTADTVPHLLASRKGLKKWLLCWIAPTRAEVERLNIEVIVI